MKTIELNGLAWDIENLEVNGNSYFTYEKANEEASKRRKRLPTKEELDSLLELPHIWDKDRKGIWIAEDIVDLKSDKALFLSAAGYRKNGSDEVDLIGDSGGYWLATPSDLTYAYYLVFDKFTCETGYNYRGTGFMVRCVQDINKPVIMEDNQEIEFKIPEGYVIDNNKSTKGKIVCKPIEIKCPKSWEDAFVGNTISGYELSSHKVWATNAQNEKDCAKNRFKTEKQALSALAYAQLTQLMALPCYNGDWTPNWDDPNQQKYCITRMKYNIVKLDYSGYFSFLAFKSEKVRDEFYHNHMDLIKQFHEL